MLRRHLLFLDLTRISVYSWHRGTLHCAGRFSSDAAGLGAFAGFLRQHRGSIYHLLADVGDEAYQIEDVPHVKGRDRKALVERRVAQYFFGTPLATAVSLGRAKAGRRDEKLMFAGLTRPERFEPWLNALRQAEAPLAGIYSLPLIMAGLSQALQRNTGRHLLLSLSGSGLRQTFVQDGHVLFSRLTALTENPIRDFPSACATEAEKLYQYLVGQRQIERGECLETLVLCHPAELEDLRGACHDSDALRFDYIDLTRLAITIGLKSVPGNSSAELLFLHLLMKKVPPWQFAPQVERKFYRLWQWRSALNAMAVAMLVSGLLFGIRQGVQEYGLRQEIESLNAEIQFSQRKYEALLKALPPTPIEADQLRALVARYRDIERHSACLDASLRQISHALESSPRVELQRIDWLASADPKAALRAGLPASDSAPPDGSYFIITELQAQLPQSLVQDHRAIDEAINRFIADLKNNKAMEVQVLHTPFDLTSAQSIKSSTQSSANTQVEPPRFVLRVIQRS